ncbi:hypothetical protein [Phycicoccus avicenniae]|uniref:hypothetical protein n=1 Tax=Phycicoccus avicenniae TaxID=2828860 RepID=UPI003D281D57
MGDQTMLRVALWVFLVVVFLVAAGLLVGCWWVIVRPVVTEAVRARRAGDWWLPWLPREDGGWGPLTANHWWSAMRAEQRGSTAGLAVRWGFWVLEAVGLTFGLGYALWGLARLLVLGVGGL